MEVMLVHLTDIHLCDDDDFDLLAKRNDALAGALCEQISDKNTKMFFCITGDIAFSGRQDEYTAVGLIFEDVCENVKKRFPGVDIQFIFVPGNHDCDFTSSKVNVRQAILSSPNCNVYDEETFKSLTDIQASFFLFLNEFGLRYKTVGCKNNQIISVYNFKEKNWEYRLVFHCINTSFCSQKRETKGSLRLEIPSVQAKGEMDIIFAMMHHDAEWLNWNDKRKWDEYSQIYPDVLMVGHDHNSEIIHKSYLEGSQHEYIKGEELYDKGNPDQSGFNICKLRVNFHEIQKCLVEYMWNGKIYKSRNVPKWEVFKRNNGATGIRFTKYMQEFVDAIDIDISIIPNQTLILSDIFAFPTLAEIDTKRNCIVRDMDTFIRYIEYNKNVAIRGNREYGKTSLLKMAYKVYFRMGKFPIIIDASSLKKIDVENLNTILLIKYKEGYEGIEAEEILQKPSSEKVCFIDNFDEINLDDKSRTKFLKYLDLHFEYIIITNNPSLNLVNPLRCVETNEYVRDKFHTLVIQKVGGSYKERIINQWILSKEPSQNVNDSSFDAKRKEIYSKVQVVMSNNFFNSTPMDLILVLSYLEQDIPTQVNYSRYSYIYEGLIVKKLTNIGRKDTNEITMYKTILQNLAYQMYNEKAKDYISEEYLLEVIRKYKKSYTNTKVKATDVIDKLVSEGFLESRNDAYRFKYGYIYYFFIANYIDSEIPHEEKIIVINEIFNNINLECNYNIALFLAYSLNIQHEMIPILDRLGAKLLTKYADFDYSNLKTIIDDLGVDIEKIVDRIHDVPKNKNIPALRQKALEMEDSLIIKDGTRASRLKTDEDINELNVDVIKIAELVNFMGNVLKHYSNKIPNEVRGKLITLMFDLVIRVIGVFCDSFSYFLNKLILYIANRIKESDDMVSKSKISQEVRQKMAELYLYFIGMNVNYLSGCLECDVIKPNLDEYVSLHQNDFARMTKVDFLIRIAKMNLPVEEITSLFSGKKELMDVSKNIFRKNIYYYLSTYQFDSREKQKICDLLGFNIKDIFLDEQKNIYQK